MVVQGVADTEHQVRQAAGGDDDRLGAELRGDPADHPVDLPGEAVDEPGLQRLLGGLADHRARLDELDLEQPGGPGGQRIDRDLDAGGQRAAEELTPGRDHVEVGRGAEVDDHRRPAVERVGGQGVDDAVGADLARVVGQQRDAGAYARTDDDGRDVGEVALEHRAELVQHRGHRRAHRDPVRCRVRGQQPTEHQRQLVGSHPRVGLDPVALEHHIAVEQPQHGVGVADVDGQEHGASRARSTPRSSTGAE